MTAPRFGDRVNAVPSGLPTGLIPPTGDFSFSKAGQIVTFTDLSVDPDGQIVSWLWDFGELIGVPVPNFTFSINGLAVTFTDGSADVPPGFIFSRSWDFGDGTALSTLTNPSHTYVAAGSYTVALTVTDNDGRVATKQRAVIVGSLGVPNGAFNMWSGDTSLQPNTSNFNSSLDFSSPSNIIPRINAARALGLKLVLAMTGGSHTRYTTNDIFQFAKWQAVQDTFNTPAIVAAVLAAVADGTILGASVMDEPPNATWNGLIQNGPYVTKATVDQMCSYVHGIFGPTLPAGAVCTYTWRTSEHFTVCDFIVTQYTTIQGAVTGYRDGALAVGTADGIRIVFSMNIINGGSRVTGCPVPATGGAGTRTPNCRMTGQQIDDYGAVLIPAGAGQFYWQWEADMMSRTDVQTAFAVNRGRANAQVKKSWLRP